MLRMLQVRRWRGSRVGVIYYSNNPPWQSIVQRKTCILNLSPPFVAILITPPFFLNFLCVPVFCLKYLQYLTAAPSCCSLCVFHWTVSKLKASFIKNYSLGTNEEEGIFSLLQLNNSLLSSIPGPVGLFNCRITQRWGNPPLQQKNSPALTFRTQRAT